LPINGGFGECGSNQKDYKESPAIQDSLKVSLTITNTQKRERKETKTVMCTSIYYGGLFPLAHFSPKEKRLNCGHYARTLYV